MEDQDRTKRIRALNDTLRKDGIGGRVMITEGINRLGRESIAHILSRVAEFEDFSEANDPYGEHDCALITVDGLTIIWKIDYYDLGLERLSPDPADPAITIRVMTIMLGSEY